MRVLFRTDASVQIGSGHLMRCLTLADSLKERGAQAAFICRELPGNLITLVEGKGYLVRRLELPAKRCKLEQQNTHSAWLGVPWQSDADEVLACLGKLSRQDWLIVDHYALDSRWETQMRPHVGRIMVIDDLADRPHDCNLLLDQNLYDRMEHRYENFVPADCRLLLGPRYALLRPEFVEARRTLRERDGSVRRILIFFGGSDQTNETAKALAAVQNLGRIDIFIDVVIGGANPHKVEIENLCRTLPNAASHCQVDNMAELMAAADLAIGAGGSATWERCVLGLPTVVMTLADNQVPIARMVASHGAVICLGNATDITVEHLRRALEALDGNHSRMQEMSRRGIVLLDGTGAEAVCSLIVSTETPA